MTTSPLSPTPPVLTEQLLSLGRHVRQCKDAQARWFGTARLAERAHGLMAPRFMTTVVGVVLLLALCNGWS